MRERVFQYRPASRSLQIQTLKFALVYFAGVCMKGICVWACHANDLFEGGIAGAHGLKLLRLHVCVHTANVRWAARPTVAVFFLLVFIG